MSQACGPTDTANWPIDRAGGYVSRTDKGFKGNLKTLSIKAPIEFVANGSKITDKQPDYIVLVDGVEVGAAWNRVSKHSGKEYVSMQLAAPEFGPRKLYANLGQAAGQDDPDTFAIIWNAGDCRRGAASGRPLPLLNKILESVAKDQQLGFALCAVCCCFNCA